MEVKDIDQIPDRARVDVTFQDGSELPNVIFVRHPNDEFGHGVLIGGKSGNHVVLPYREVKSIEVYAPDYEPGWYVDHTPLSHPIVLSYDGAGWYVHHRNGNTYPVNPIEVLWNRIQRGEIERLTF